jgi:hypothetical protein
LILLVLLIPAAAFNQEQEHDQIKTQADLLTEVCDHTTCRSRWTSLSGISPSEHRCPEHREKQALA